MNNRYVVAFKTAGISPIGITTAVKYTRGEKYTVFFDEHGGEVAWFNTCEIGGMWLVNESSVIGGESPSGFIGRRN